MKRIVLFVLIAAFGLAISACSAPSAQENAAAIATIQAPANQALIDAIKAQPTQMPYPTPQPTQDLAKVLKDAGIGSSNPMTSTNPISGTVKLDLPAVESLRTCLTTSVTSVGSVECAKWKVDAKALAMCQEYGQAPTGETRSCAELITMAKTYQQLGFGTYNIASGAPTPQPVRLDKGASDDDGLNKDGCMSVFAYDRPPQPQIGHPSVYLSTGVNQHTQCWNVSVKEGFTLVIGGFEVDGVSDGVYRAVQGPAEVTTTVTDGFIALPVNEFSEAEYCFRLGQAVDFGWAHATEEPLAGWKCETATADSAQPTAVPTKQTAAPKATAAPTAPAAAERRPTRQNVTLAFKKGEAVYGWYIKLASGKVCDDGECYLPNAPEAGEVKSGVINPWPNEVPASTKVWKP